MANLKETPRQKMIGMMYLVLTALLALQVSDALLQKFTLLNSSLEIANQSSHSKNKGMVEGIEQRIKDLPNPAAYSDVITRAQNVRKISDEIVNYLDGLKSKIIDAGGGIDPETGMVKNPKEEEKVFELMVGANKSGEAYHLVNLLDKYVANLEKLADPGTKFSKLALAANEDPTAKMDANQANKDFAELNFQSTPVPAALASLSQKQAEVRRYESEVLNQLAAKVGAKEIKFDKVFAQVSANANTVVAGMDYEAEVFIAATSSGFTPRMSYNGSSIPVQDGRGKIKFKTSGGGYDANGLSRKTYVATVSYMSPAGPKTESITKEYFVLKPTYNIETATLPALYLGCANRLSVVSPGLGSLWNPNFSADGGEAIGGANRGKVTIVPSASTITLNVSNGGTLLGKEVFRVRRVPRPEVKVFGNGGELDEKRGASASGLRTIDARAIADESFKSTNPEDANFRVAEVYIALARGQRKIDDITLQGSGSIAKLASQAQAGDRYYIEIKGVQRKNFKGTVETIPYNMTKNIPLN
ncbi:gliding motility protein GldM [Sandaracinomonas limnophila]|uniref:Gliding motility protein GldM n=1 Tax=Sandaracinomonas limnophila TaxID=1862386 RepID=A0A437PMM9_9BACT|nr:gliding motility protein GldM [Sandaracinomonas limnophila]RVU23532.1 gliding motility protein GldM [Sandaracinomonas limnophila]